jgi:type I restriction enzyme S subunit
MLKPYEAYKNMNEFWLQNIPSSWNNLKIKYVFDERIEKGYPDKPLLAASQNMGVVPKKVYGSRTVEATKDLHLLKLVKTGDFVISLRSFQGGIEYAYYEGIISPAYTVMSQRIDINPQYYKYLFKSIGFIALLKNTVTGIREGQNVDYQCLKNHCIPIPPRSEQDQIVRFLDWKVSMIDKYIAAKKKEMALLREQKQAVINQAVTKGLNPDVPMKDSGIEWIGKIPEGWETKPLKRYVRTNLFSLDNSTSDNLLLNYIDISTVGFGCLKGMPEKYYFKNAPLRARRIVHAGDTIISTVRTYLKSMCYIDESFDNHIVSTGFAVLTPNKSVFPKLLHYVLSANYFINTVNKYSIGISYPAISDTKLSSIKIALSPSIKEQQMIYDTILAKIENQDLAMQNLSSIIEKMREYRTRLISDVVTGKVDVRDVEVGI